MCLFGWRIADLFIEIEHGDPYLIAQNIMGQGKNIVSGSNDWLVYKLVRLFRFVLNPLINWSRFFKKLNLKRSVMI
jgi:hypothetical protein